MTNYSNHNETDLEKTEVRDDISNILHSMEDIREKTITQRNISEKNTTKYTKLAEDLALKLKTESDNNPAMLNRIQNTIDSIDQSNVLLNYDPVQDTLWKQKDINFINNLTELCISIAKDTFSSTKERYHIFQAIKCFKYLTCNSEDLKDISDNKENIYNTILPIQKSKQLEDDSFWKRVSAFFIGETYNVQKVDNFTLKIIDNITLNSLDTLIHRIEGNGYNFMRLKVPKKELILLQEKYPNTQIETTFEYIDSDDHSNSELIEVEMNITKSEDKSTIDALKYLEEFQALHSEKLSKYLNRDESNTIIKYFEDTNKTEKATSIQSQISDIHNINTLLLSETNIAVFSNSRTIDEYTKYSVLVYKNDSKNLNEYLLTTIIPNSKLTKISSNQNDVSNNNSDNNSNYNNKDSSDNQVISKIISVLISEDDNTTKMENLTNNLTPSYIRLRKFDNEQFKEYGDEQ